MRCRCPNSISIRVGGLTIGLTIGTAIFESHTRVEPQMGGGVETYPGGTGMEHKIRKEAIFLSFNSRKVEMQKLLLKGRVSAKRSRGRPCKN